MKLTYIESILLIEVNKKISSLVPTIFETKSVSVRCSSHVARESIYFVHLDGIKFIVKQSYQMKRKFPESTICKIR